jgi:lysophospholipase L1-like esterase
MRISFHGMVAASLLMAASVVAQPAPAAAKVKAHDFARWEKDIAAFEKSDAANPPPKHAVLFIGSSSIVRWKTLAEDFKGTVVLNRAFGGNEIVDSTHFAERMIFPYEPKMIFMRAGGNDIHAGLTPEEVFAEFKDFVAKMRERLPEVPIAYMALSPSIARWDEREKGDQMNALIAAYIKTEKNLIFVDDSKISLDANGQPRPELFVADHLHFSEAGNQLMAEAVRPFLPKISK